MNEGVVDGVEAAVELVPELASLPKEEVEDLLKLMVERGLAKWVDKKRRVLRVCPPEAPWPPHGRGQGISIYHGLPGGGGGQAEGGNKD